MPPQSHTPWPLLQARWKTSANHTSPWPNMHRASLSHLYPASSPSVTPIRAFTSVARPLLQTKMIGADVDGQVTTARADHVRDMGMLKSVIKHGITNRPLPPSLEEVRQKYRLDGPEFNGYWHRAADAELRRRTKTESATVLERAERTLQLRLEATGKDLTLTHEGLMEEARQIATRAFREKQAAPFKRHQLITMHIKKVIEEAKIPDEHVRVLKSLYSRISELEHLMERIASKGVTAEEASETYGYGLPGLDPRNKAQPRKRNEKPTLEEIETLQKSIRSKTVEPIPTKIQQIQQLLDMYRQQAADVEEETQKLRDIRIRREQVLARRRELMEQMKEQEARVKETESAARATWKGPVKGDVDAILKDALRKQKRTPTETDGSASKPEGLEPIFDAFTQTEEDTLVPVRKTGVESVSVLKPRDTSGAAAERDEGVLADPIMDKPDTYTKSAPSTGSDSTPQTSTVDEGAKASDMFPPKPPPPYISPLLSISRKPLEKPSNDLHLDVTPAGFVPIDENLVVTFEAGIPQLQTQLLEMRNRLKHSYPRIDSLPYEVWKSENHRMLQTWLRILVRKWQTRFDDVKTSGPLRKGVRDVRIEDVLDEMVRDHDLSNEAAERMAVRWYEVFTDKGRMTGDAEGRIDKDELHAGGLDFLLDEVSEPESQVQVTLETKSSVSGSGDSGVGATSGSLSMLGAGNRRMYSTSSRPPPPSSQQDTEQRDNEKTTQASSSNRPPATLPHLTSTGSAHMVSISTKTDTIRTAIAVGTVHFTNPTPLTLIRSNSAKKGDVLGVSRIAGIMAAKKCPDIIPLCHPIALTHVGVELKPFSAIDDNSHGGVHIEAKVQCVGPTGVEMEALTAVMGAALSVVDMCKAVDRFQRVGDVKVVLKEGGRSGEWKEEGWRSKVD